MDEQLWREILRGMDVVTADGHSLGRVGEVYFTSQQAGAWPSGLPEAGEQAAHTYAQRAAPSQRHAASALSGGDPVLSVQHRIGGRDLFVPLEAVRHVEGDVVELSLTLADLER